jgi:S1-C subfamily serine protease
MIPSVVVGWIALAPTPIVASRDFTPEAQWAAALACPRIVPLVVDRGATGGTGVTVGVRGGVAYVLTAAHAVSGSTGFEVQYFSRDSYPLRAQSFDRVSVAVRIPDADFALLKVETGSWPAPTLKLAGPGRRPKAFPAPAFTVGCTDKEAPTCAVESVRAKRLVRRPGNEVAFFWETAAAPQPGRSGGPLVGTDEQVIGICSAFQDGSGYYVHLDEIQAGLKQAGYGWLWEN